MTDLQPVSNMGKYDLYEVTYLYHMFWEDNRMFDVSETAKSINIQMNGIDYVFL